MCNTWYNAMPYKTVRLRVRLYVLLELDDERQLSVFTRLACGAVAGTTGQTVAYPLDVVRRRLQVSSCPHSHSERKRNIR